MEFIVVDVVRGQEGFEGLNGLGAFMQRRMFQNFRSHRHMYVILITVFAALLH
jgi:hypothetical protein